MDEGGPESEGESWSEVGGDAVVVRAALGCESEGESGSLEIDGGFGVEIWE